MAEVTLKEKDLGLFDFVFVEIDAFGVVAEVEWVCALLLSCKTSSLIKHRVII